MRLLDIYTSLESEFGCYSETDRRFLREKIRLFVKGYGVKASKPEDMVPDQYFLKLISDVRTALANREKNKALFSFQKTGEKKAEKAGDTSKESAEEEKEEKPAAKKKAASSAKKTDSKEKEAAKTAKKTSAAKDEDGKTASKSKAGAEKKTAKTKTAADTPKEKSEETAVKPKTKTITAKSRKKEEQEKEAQERLRLEEEERLRKAEESDRSEEGGATVINLDAAADSRVKSAKVTVRKINFTKQTATAPAKKEPKEEETPAGVESVGENVKEEETPEAKPIGEPVKEKQGETAPKEVPQEAKEEGTKVPEAPKTEAAKPAESPIVEETPEVPAEKEKEQPKTEKSGETSGDSTVGDVVKPVSTVSVATFVAQQQENLPRVTETVPLDRLKGWRPPELGKKKSSQKSGDNRPANNAKPSSGSSSAQSSAPMGDANRKGENRRSKGKEKDKGKDKDSKFSSASREEMMNRPRISGLAQLRQRNADERANEEGEYRIRRGKNKKQQTQSQPTKADIVKGDIKISVPISIRDFSQEIGIKSGDIIKIFFKLGEMFTINSALDQDHVELAAAELGVNVIVKSKEENLEAETFNEEAFEEELTAEEAPRAPVVVFMGHVDHGKTSLIDAIRQSKVAQGESGGITQHIGAYEVDTSHGHITIIDTPGHEAFTTMRARGANATDIAVLVVAADDGIMPQTLEAINHARAAKVEIIVAINKMDLPGADPDRVIRQLAENNILVEDWKGDTQCVRVSAHTKQGLDKLLEAIALQAEVMQLKARADGPAEGVVLEAELNPGRGTSVTLLVQKGKLKVGDPIVCGTCYAKARAMMNYKGESIKVAGPSQPVQILGFTEVPQPGAKFRVAASEKLAKDLTDKRREEERIKLMETRAGATLENFFSTLQNNNSSKELPLIVKGDTRGTTEAVRSALEKLSTDEVKVNVIHNGVGDVTENDVMLASASNGIIIAFKTSVPEPTRAMAKSKGVEIRRYDVIYHATEQIQKALLGLLEPTFHEEETGVAEVRQLFTISGTVVAGSHVISGEIHRTDKVRVMRGKEVLFDGEIQTLKHLKDDVKEIRSGYDCGIVLNGFNDFAEGDKLNAYKMVRDGLAE